LVLMLAGGRWYVAHQRIDRVVAKASIRDASAQAKPGTALATTVLRVPGGGEAAAAASLLIANAQQHRERAEAERAALPVIAGAMDAATFSKLATLADDGNARAACVLSVQISKCTQMPRVAAESVEQLTAGIAGMRRQGNEPGPDILRVLRHSTEAQQRLASECANTAIPAGEEPWSYLLQAALQGHPSAMSMFLSRAEWLMGEMPIDATAAYLRYGGPMLEAMAQRGMLDGVTTAIWGYGDFGYNTLEAMGMRLLPREPARSLLWAYVREGILMRREAVDPTANDGQGSPHALIERVEPLVDAAGRQWARQMADQTLASMDPKVFVPPAAPTAADLQEQLWETLDRECRE